MTRTALAIEIEEVLFDTRAMRVSALHQALDADGLMVDAAELTQALAGATTAMTVAVLPGVSLLDAVARDLIVRRADDTFHALLGGTPPQVDVQAAETLRTLAVDHPIAVVTRASHADAQWMLDMAGLDASVNIIRSLAAHDADQYHTVWQDVTRRLHADRGVAIAPAPLLASAQLAGMRTIRTGMRGEMTTPPLVPFPALDASYIASLF